MPWSTPNTLQFEAKPIAICRSSKNNTTALQPTATSSKRRLHVFQILRCKGATTSVAERKYRKIWLFTMFTTQQLADICIVPPQEIWILDCFCWNYRNSETRNIWFSDAMAGMVPVWTKHTSQCQFTQQNPKANHSFDIFRWLMWLTNNKPFPKSPFFYVCYVKTIPGHGR